jgi:serine protease inhibitor
MTRREWIFAIPVGLALSGKDAMPEQTVESAHTAVAAEKDFGLRLLRDIVDRKPKQNVFVSPLSVFLALQMAENGAAGATRAAMRKTLGLPAGDATESNASTSAMETQLTSQSSVTLAIANALWADQHFTLNADYVKLCESQFHARASSLDFSSAAAPAQINDWVKSATKGKIADIVTADAVRKAAVILTNAVYFAGGWGSEFPKEQTQDAPFHLADGSTVNVPMMHHGRLTGAYRAGSNFEGAVLRYKQSGIFFLALLPKAGSSPREVVDSLDPAQISNAPSEFDLELKLPRFQMDFSMSMADPLKRMGMEPAFRGGEADFSPMGSKQFFLSDVIHKTRLEVDEKGTVAAAATGIVMRATAMMAPRPIKTLVFDRPFALFLGDAQTGALLFAGAIEKP